MRNNREVPVFFDPDHKRWPRLRRGVFLTGLALSILFGLLIVSILINPKLPDLNLPQSSILPNGGHATAPPLPDKFLTPRQRLLHEAKQRLEFERSRRLYELRHQDAPRIVSDDRLDFGFYVNWDESSMSSLKENINNLDVLIAEFYSLQDADGTLHENDPERQKLVLDYVRARAPKLPVFALVNNFYALSTKGASVQDKGKWEAEKLKAMLDNPRARANCIQQLLDFAREERFAGISIDFESVLDEAQAGLNQFVTELAIALHKEGLELSVNVPANNDSFDYRRLSTDVDYLILMAYDEHYSGSKPGPIAGLDWFEEVLHTRQNDVPASKMVIAIGNYAYDWAGNGEPTVKTFEEAILTAKESSDEETRVDIEMSPGSLNPTFKYEENEGEVHEVWMLDAVTAFNQMAIARPFAPRGVALWRMGAEDPSIWTFFGHDEPLGSEAAAKLSAVRYGYGLDYELNGDILKIREKPKEGSREIGYDPERGLITSIKFNEFPSPYVIARYGAVPNKIALTFDDGPDPQYTPEILDILKKANCPATFFVVGLNGEQNPNLLKREVNEGHDIGNHTFTHPNIADISDTQFGLELRATPVLFESVIGRRSHLFRPPFAEDSEPNTPDEVKPLELVTDRGYLTVGMLIDPGDWKRPGVQEIIDQTIAKAKNGDGNVVLLHDSGGDRSQTIEALPELIARLRAEGFELVTISQLLGKSRDEIMPPIPPDRAWQAWAGWAAFGTLNSAVIVLHVLFLTGILLGIGRLLFIGALAIVERWRERHAHYDPGYSPSVAVIVPAFNEETVIVQTITSLLASGHPPGFEIIVVDDGSVDGTFERARQAFQDEPRVRLFRKHNSGKPDALNFGVANTDAEIIVTLDADTVFARDTISKLVRHFCNPKIGAVAGNAKVGNRINLLTRWQALEYVTSQNLDRRAFNTLNCITVVPGAVGAWRRELVLRVGGFNHFTLAEDADLTMAILKLGYSIAYEDEAIGLTEAPDTVRGFIRQRYRWMYGTLQAAWRHADALFRPRFGSLGFVALPNIFIFQVFFPLISPAMDLLMLVTLVLAGVNKLYHPNEYTPDSLWRVLFYYALFVAVDFMAAALAFFLEPKENKRLLVWLFWQRFFYRQLMYYVAIKSTLASLQGISVGWNKVERKATVKQVASD